MKRFLNWKTFDWLRKVSLHSLTNTREHLINDTVLSPRFKKFGEIRLGSKLSLDLIYGLSFRIKAASYFPQSLIQKTGLIFYLADFHGKNWRIPSFYENKTQLWALFSTKTNQGRFFFIGPNSLSRAEDLAAVNHVTQAVVRVGSKIGS